ncbi:hypothetical protein CXB51_025930 [Gossypium anomalum]|uniref:Uncharacterized protein n=1 Tax=Gossypium anomalum TaxID=47600 RepID=A0A8J5YH52_9ROSI|nr:hypothetical protein CXB51_025930 [Gossypium anomalum]
MDVIEILGKQVDTYITAHLIYNKILSSPLYVVVRFFLLFSHQLVSLICFVILLLNMSLNNFLSQANLLMKPFIRKVLNFQSTTSIIAVHNNTKSKKSRGEEKLRLRSLKMRRIGSSHFQNDVQEFMRKYLSSLLYVVVRFFLLFSHQLVSLIHFVILLLNLLLNDFEPNHLLMKPLMLLLRLTVRSTTNTMHQKKKREILWWTLLKSWKSKLIFTFRSMTGFIKRLVWVQKSFSDRFNRRMTK